MVDRSYLSVEHVGNSDAYGIDRRRGVRSFQHVRVHLVERREHGVDIRSRRHAGRITADMYGAAVPRAVPPAHGHAVAGSDDERWSEPAPHGRGRPDAFLGVLHWIDFGIAKEVAWNYASSNAKKELSPDEKITGRWDWRVWRYQQCREAGVLEVSQKPGGIFTRQRGDFIDECETVFKEKPYSARGKEWSPRAMVKNSRYPWCMSAVGWIHGWDCAWDRITR